MKICDDKSVDHKLLLLRTDISLNETTKAKLCCLITFLELSKKRIGERNITFSYTRKFLIN